MVRSGRARQSETLPRTSAQSPRQLERASPLLSLPSLPISLSGSRHLNRSLSHAGSFSHPFWFLRLPLYIFPTFFLHPRYLLSSLAFAPFQRRHPLRRCLLSSSFSLAPFPSSARRPRPTHRFFAPVSFASSSHSVFHFFPAASGAARGRAQRDRDATRCLDFRVLRRPRIAAAPARLRSPFLNRATAPRWLRRGALIRCRVS